MKGRKYTIYYHEFPNGKLYFGQTCMEPEKRWKNGLGYKTQPLVFRAILKYGWENIKHQIVSINLDKEEADFQERFYISAYDTTNPEKGYNIAEGGGGVSGFKHTDEALKKMRESHKGKYNGEKNPMYGKHHSIEARKKLSEANKGKHLSDETRKKMSITMKGVPRPKCQWLTPSGEIVEMSKPHALRHHPDWVQIN